MPSQQRDCFTQSYFPSSLSEVCFQRTVSMADGERSLKEPERSQLLPWSAGWSCQISGFKSSPWTHPACPDPLCCPSFILLGLTQKLRGGLRLEAMLWMQFESHLRKLQRVLSAQQNFLLTCISSVCCALRKYTRSYC